MEVVSGTRVGLQVRIEEASQVGQARRLAAALAGRLGFDETARANVSILATELATNLLKHGGGGELVVRSLERGGVIGIEFLAIDKGPGMENVAMCMRDGYSTAGSPGTGLGAVSRIASELSVHSVPGAGTVAFARLWDGPVPGDGGGLEIGAVCLPKPGEAVSGDAWAAERGEGRTVVMVADGLGHGESAAEAAREAVAVFGREARAQPAEILAAAHGALRGTRGAAVAVAAVDHASRQVAFAGIGNVAAALVSPGRVQYLVSHNGTVGADVRKIQEFAYPWPAGGALVMHSDGLGTGWRLDRYPGLLSRHPSLVAAVLYRDFARGRDDATAVVAAETGGRP